VADSRQHPFSAACWGLRQPLAASNKLRAVAMEIVSFDMKIFTTIHSQILSKTRPEIVSERMFGGRITCYLGL
jgi:hypothetical protein